MSKSNLPFLPNLTEGYALNIADPGNWNDNNEFDKLVSSLKVTTDDNTQISSIPDILARPKLFTDVLTNSQHPLYNRYNMQWRALMTIMALRRLRSAEKRISVEPIVIPKRISPDMPDFLKVLVKSPLKDYIQQQQDKTFNEGETQAIIYVVTFDERPFAIAWPNVFICPAADIEKYMPLDDTFPWWKRDGFDNPVPYLTIDEGKLVCAWLKNIMEHIPGDKIYGKLMDLLRSFTDDIKASLDIDIEEKEVKMFVDDTKRTMTGFVSLIDAPIDYDISKEPLNTSDIQLKNMKGNTEVPRLLILAHDISNQYGDPNTISLAGPIKVGSILNECQIFGRPKSTYLIDEVDLRNYGAEMRMAEDFFTDRLGVVLIKNVFQNTYNSRLYKYLGGDASFIFPLKPEILDYLTVEYVANNMEFKVKSDDEIEVTFKLPIEGQDRPLVARKTYKTEIDSKDYNVGSIVELAEVPVVQVWPNLVMKNWNAYYTYFDACGKTGTFRAEPTWSDALKRSFPVVIGDKTEIYKGKEFPEGFKCFYTELNGFEGEERELGLILLVKPTEHSINTTLNHCRIGIDFGTTNTVAYIKNGEGNRSLITLQNRMLDVCYAGGGQLDAIGQRQLRQNFLSTKDQPDGKNVSIRTMFHHHNDAAETKTNTVLFKGNIYYLDDFDNINQDKNILMALHHSDLKWSTAKSKENTWGFLKQLCLQCMVEAAYRGAASIEWRFSFPAAFSIAQINDYENLWSTYIRDELQSVYPVNNENANFYTESECVFHYFRDEMEAKTNSGMVCIDIGGGSTDIAIRQGNISMEAPQHQASIKFAGRDILNNYLWIKHSKNNNSFEALKSSTDNKLNSQIDEIKKVKDEKEFSLQLEALLKYKENELIEGLSASSTDGTFGAQLVSDITFALGGVFYYVGYVVGKLRNASKYTEMEALPKIYVGGNASKLLNWAAKGYFTDSNITHEFFTTLFRAGLYNAERKNTPNKFMTICMTKAPKQEVAAGLLSDNIKAYSKDQSAPKLSEDIDMEVGLDSTPSTIETNTEAISSICYAGESCEYVDGSKSDIESLTAEDLAKGIRIPSVDKIPVLHHYVSIFNQLAKKINYQLIEFSDADYFELRRSINDDLSDNVGRPVEEIVVEPLFITVLKAAIEYNAKR